MSYELDIRIFYPLKSGRIVLRTNEDWNTNLEATKVDREQSYYEFKVRSAQPFLYFKPCIADGDNFYWSKGENYLAIMRVPEEPGSHDIYPHFFSELNGTISDRMKFATGHGGEDHVVRIYYPPGYQENTLKRYPVLYMHDGNNLFFPDEAFVGVDWEVERTLEDLDSMNIVDDLIVVGIYPNDRMYEYTQPGYTDYGNFIVNDLKPVIDRDTRTLTDAKNTGVMGSSLGGVVSLHLAWQWPEVFGMAACLSSTFGYQDNLMDRISSEEKRDIKIYIDSGWPEDNYEPTRCMRDLLTKRNYKFGEELLYFAFPEAHHNEKFWAMRCHIPFQFLFGKTPQFKTTPLAALSVNTPGAS